MNPSTDNKIVLVVRNTRLDELIARHNTVGQAKFYVEHMGVPFEPYIEEDRVYKMQVSAANTALSKLGRVHVLQRRYLPSYIFGDHDLVVVIGQDGLVANTVKYLDGQAVIGVNPDPTRWDGVLLPFRVMDLRAVVTDVFASRARTREVTMAMATLNDGQRLYAVNDFFIGAKTHVSARYEIAYGESAETHSSSGVIVSTGLGASGWLRSVITGANGIVQAVGGGQPVELDYEAFGWESPALYFAVREPFPSRHSKATINFGQLDHDQPLKLCSQMAEDGVIFSDGIEADYLGFQAGMTATIEVADRRGRLVVC